MAKKKAIEPIVGPGKDPENKLTIQKSNPLLSLWRSDMSLAEFKILDTYLSRINSHEPDKRTVVFTKGELEQLLGVKKINKADLTARLKGLGRFVEVEEKNSKKLHQVALFEEAYGEMDENGLWTVKLTCTSKAMKYIFNVDKLGYLRYRLHSITRLNSRYAYILFLHLERNRSLHLSWEEDVDFLRQLLKCDQDELYKEFKFFNQRILKRCQKEIQEKTPCRFEYTPVKKGRKVTAVRFTLESIAVAPVAIEEQLTVFDDAEDPVLSVAATLPKDFTEAQIRAVYMAAEPVAAGLYGVTKPTPSQVMGYLQHAMGRLLAYAAKNPIPHKDKYLHRIIENDFAKLAAAPKPEWDQYGRRGLDEDELKVIAAMFDDDEPATVGTDPELAARAAKLQESLTEGL